jgi:hypothetical protein
MSNDELKGSYSPMETVIFGALRKQGAATTDTLLRKVYPRKADEPFNALIVINRAATTLAKKLAHNHESYRLERKRRPRQRQIENRLIKKTREATA